MDDLDVFLLTPFLTLATFLVNVLNDLSREKTMRQLKKTSSLLVVPMVLGLVACGDDESSSPKQPAAANTIVDVVIYHG